VVAVCDGYGSLSHSADVLWQSWMTSRGHHAIIDGRANLFGYVMTTLPGRSKYFACGITCLQR
jgi:hypothetical protein